MSYYLLPRTNHIIHQYIDCVDTKDDIQPVISTSLAHYLYEIKKKLETMEKDWDIFKKYTNPYEYVHGIVPLKKKSVSKYKPLSRSYFKMIEIMHSFHIDFQAKNIRTFHLAEGPGGFIEAIANLRNNEKDIYIGISLLDDKSDPNIPAWKKTQHFLNSHKNVYIETGVDNTGNILSMENFTFCKDTYASSMELVTADGGFDFSMDFNKQEINIAKLLFAQICYALILQKKKGCFVLKMFDCFMQHSIDALCILSSFYEKVYITKPQSSRYANSEKYIVCKGFLYSKVDSFYPFIHRAFEKMLAPTKTPTSILRFLTVPVNNLFVTKLEEYNAIFGQQQVENIYQTIMLIENKHNQEKIDIMIKNNVQKSIQWCTRYQIPYNILLPPLEETIFK
jgi:23S rRNA U2552 (ribose-2'-O)-methylase RlmE/FtsJ